MQGIQKKLLVIFILGCMIGIRALPVFAQEGEYSLNVHKVLGYSAGSQLRGKMVMDIIGPEEGVKSAAFMIDGEIVGTDSEAPFSLTFETTDYATGWHELSASLQLKDNRTMVTPVKRFEFATAQQEMDTIQRILFPILGVVIGVTILGMGSQFLFRNRPLRSLPLGAPRTYGVTGGAICPRCQRPFSLHWWSLHMGGWRYDRCEFCGKWALMKRVSRGQLAQAEAAEIAMAQPKGKIGQESEEEKLKAMIEDSRYVDE